MKKSELSFNLSIVQKQIQDALKYYPEETVVAYCQALINILQEYIDGTKS